MPPAPGPARYVFITPVWGDAYVERFVKLSLPSQLSAGNLGAVPAGAGLYLVYTRRRYARAVVRSAAFRRLRATTAVSVRLLDDLPDPLLGTNPHELQTAAYQRGIAAGAGSDAAFVFLTPDLLMADGTLASAVRLAAAGKRVHLLAGVRMLTDGAVACAVRHRTGPGVMTVPPRALVRACLDHLHPISRGHVVADGRVRAAQHLYWPVGGHGLLARGYHVHPLLVWPRDPAATILKTVDDEYVARACPDPAEWHTVTDSDEMCVIEFSEARHKREMVSGVPLGDREVARFLRDGTTPAHRDHVRHRLRFHTRGVVPGEWAAAEAESDALVARHLDLHARGVPADPDPPAATPTPLTRPAAPGRKPGAVLRAVYRLLNRPVYQYLGRLNAENVALRTQLAQSLAQLATVSRLCEELVARVGELEDAAVRRDRRRAG